MRPTLTAPLRGIISDATDTVSDNRVMATLTALFVGAIAASGASHLRTAAPDVWAWLDGFWQNFGTEMFGAFLTFYLIEVLVGERRERQADDTEAERGKALRDAELQVEKERLILQMGSPFNEFAVEAARQLHSRGWLTDGTLQGAQLPGANLEGADLREANLQRANFGGANLQDVNFWGAYLKGVTLVGANLRDAKLWKVDMQGAHLFAANLQGVKLNGTNLQGAQAVTIEQLKSAETLEGATLPDGTRLAGREKGYDPEPDWRTPFEEWCKTVETDEDGAIIPVPLDDGPHTEAGSAS